MKKENIHFTLLNKRPTLTQAVVKDLFAPVDFAEDYVEKVKIFRNLKMRDLTAEKAEVTTEEFETVM